MSSAITAAEEAATAGLIRPWKAVYDASSQDFYFWHELSGEVSWVKPTNSLTMRLPDGWTAVLDEETHTYFYWHQQLDLTQWEMPTAASAAAAASPPPSESEESPPPDESSDGAAGAEAAGAEAAAADATGAAAGGAGGDGWSDDDGDEASGAAAVPDEAAAPAAPQRKGRAVIAGESVDPTAPGVGVFGGAPTPGSGAVPELVVVPKSEASKALILSVLQGSFLFSQLAAGELDRVAGAMTSKAVSAGEVVIQQGDKGDYFYVVESGTFAITVDGAYVKTCGGGDSFGELSLLYSCPRAATVTADTAGHLWALDRAVFRFMVASTRESQLVDIVRGLRNVELLKALTDDQLSRVAEAVKVVGFKRGERIISKGELGAELFFVRTGAVRCFGATAAGAALEDVVIDAGGHFGERALLLGAPRAANVEAHAEGTTCYVLGRRAFAELLGPLKDLMERSLSMRVLASLPALARLAPAARERVVRSMRALELRDGDVLARAGAPYDSFYLVTRGTLRVARPAGDTELIGQGAYLGARALFGDEVADADVCAQGAAAVCALSRLELDAVLQGAAAAAYGGLRGGADAAAAAAAAATPGGTPSASARRMVAVAADPAAALAATPPRHTVPLAELETLRTLGAGTFGRVKLVRHRPSGRAFALKVLQKAQIVAFSQQKNVLNERNVLLAVDHPFVLKLESTAQDDDCLYMLLEYVQGGELFSYLANSKLGYIPVADARFYAACVLAGVGALHAQNILYRDLKPENMMIDREGYLKIVDMGFAKAVKDRTYTLCGTPEYLAPELVLGQGHFKGVDIWAIGVLLFELVSGRSPFCDPANNDQMVICKNIVKGKFAWPSHVRDRDLKDLVSKLLVRSVPARLGCRKDGIAEIMEHKFFAAVSWPALLAKKLPAPWLPPIKDDFDARCFGRCDGDERITPYVDDGSGWAATF